MNDTEPDRESPWQTWLVLAGLGCLALGALVAISGIGVGFTQSLLGIGGVLTLFAGVGLLVRGLSNEPTIVAFPAVDYRRGSHFVGAAFERRVTWASEIPASVQPAVRTEIQTTLRELARSFLTASGPASEPLETGSWTSDRVAAAFLDPNGVTAPGRRLTFSDRVRRTVDALAAAILAEESPRRFRTETIPAETTWTHGTHSTGHWLGLGAIAVVCLAGAMLLGRPALAVVAGTFLGLIGYVAISRPPTIELSVEREFDTDSPRPGESVSVTLRVTNTGATYLPDVRLCDDIPDRLARTDGSARHAVALAPGATATVEYAVRTVFGEHDFEALHVAVRDPSGAHERTETIATTRQTLSCEPGRVTEPVPLHPQTSGVTGRVTSDAGGSGQEFRSVREYRRGDPLRRVDWKRLARTGELATVELRAEHAATVVILVDARESAFSLPARGESTAIDRSLAGAWQLFETLAADGDRVGLGSMQPDGRWIDPGAGSAHRSQIRATLASDAFEPREDWQSVAPAQFSRQLRRRLPAEAELLVCSPLLDEDVGDIVRRLHAVDYPVTVFSPDPTDSQTVGGTIERLRRRRTIESLRREGIDVVDWGQDESLASAVATHHWRDME